MRRSDRLNRSGSGLGDSTSVISEDLSTTATQSSSSNSQHCLLNGAGDDEISIAIDDHSSDISSASDLKRRRRVLICRNPVAAVSLTNSFLSAALGRGPGGDYGGSLLPELSFDATRLTASPLSGPRRFCTVLESSSSPTRPVLQQPTDRSSTSEATNSSESDFHFKRPVLPPRKAHTSSSTLTSTSSLSLSSSPNNSQGASSSTLCLKRRYNNDVPFPSEKTSYELKSKPVADDDSETQELFAGARHLTNWVPRLHGKKFIIEGDLLDFNAANPNHYQDRWKTSKVYSRKLKNLVQTRSSAYVLEGRLNFKHALQNDTPQFVIQAFVDGFPENWEVYRDQWRLFLREQSLNSSGCSTISSVGEKSTFVPRMSALPLPKGKIDPGVLLTVVKADPDKVAPNVKKCQKPPVQAKSATVPVKERAKKTAGVEATKKKAVEISAPGNSHGRRKRNLKDVNQGMLPAVLKEQPKVPKGKRRQKPVVTEHVPVKCQTKKTVQAKSQAGATTGRKKKIVPGGIMVNAEDQREASARSNSKGRSNRKEAIAVPKEPKEIKKRGQKSAKEKIEIAAALEAAAKSNARGKSKKSNELLEPAALPEYPKVRVRLLRLEDCQKLSPDQRRQVEKLAAATNSKSVPSKALPPPPSQLVSNPKTVRERKNNTAILQSLNANHKDDFFQSDKSSHQPAESSSNKFVSHADLRPSDIVSDLFDSDSENDISIHSARTPIGNYMMRSSRSQTPVPSSLDCSSSKEDQELPVNLFKDHAFIHRKVKESKKTHKLFGTKVKSPQLFPMASNRTPKITKPVANMMNEVGRRNDGDDDSDDFEEPYFDDEDIESLTGSVAHAPEGLLDEYQRESFLKGK